MATGSYTMALEPRPLASMLAEPATEYITFLFCARQSRLMALAHPIRTDHYRGCARYWLAMAHRAQGPPLP